MKVKDLIVILNKYNPDAEVAIGQNDWNEGNNGGILGRVHEIIEIEQDSKHPDNNDPVLLFIDDLGEP